MSADFWSFIVELLPDEADRVAAQLRAGEVVSDVFGPDGSSLQQLSSGELADPVAIARAYAGRTSPREIGATYVEATMEDIDALLDHGVPLESTTYASLVALDRAVALPHGVLLLGGRAVRAVPPADVPRLIASWAALVARLGRAQVISSAAAYIDRNDSGETDAIAALDALDQVLASAQRAGSSVLLLGCVVP